MELKFARYTDVTAFAKKVNPEYEKQNYQKVLVYLDTFDYWVVRILKDINEDYEKQDGVFLLDRDKVEKENKSDKLNIKTLEDLLINDEFENYDTFQRNSLDELMELLDDGFGIDELDENGVMLNDTVA